MNSLIPDSSQYDLDRQLKACQSSRRRNGKVARLPFALRQQINFMLDDGLPYKTIIRKLGPPGRNLNEDNIGSWRMGGYQDYLKAQAINERARAQTEAAADVVRESGGHEPSMILKACNEIALLHYLGTMIEHGKQLARETFKSNPAKMITLMNACSGMSNAARILQKTKTLAVRPDSRPDRDQPSPVKTAEQPCPATPPNPSAELTPENSPCDSSRTGSCDPATSFSESSQR